MDEGSRTIGRYILLEPLGEGGMGTVYRARDGHLGRLVALKVVRAGREEHAPSKDATARMLREARAAAALTHPNVVAIYDAGEEDGIPWIAMELVEGVALRKLIAGDASAARRLEWLRQVAEALGAAHALGIVHRDIKPDNVVIRDGKLAKVLDFGLARRPSGELAAGVPAAPDLATITQEGGLIGTPAYMAPEQIGGGVVDALGDQFAWGVMAFEVLSRRLPWPPGLTTSGTLAHILTKEPAPLQVAGVAPAVAAVIARAMAREPSHRFESMAQLSDALDAEATPRDDSAATPATRASDAPALDVASAPTEVVPPELAGTEIALVHPAASSPTDVADDREAARRPGAAVVGPGNPRGWSARRRTGWLVVAAIAVAGVLLAAARLAEPPLPPPGTSGSAAASPLVPARTILNEPAPTSTSNAEALAEYRKGRLLQRDCDWLRAMPHFAKAAALAPEMGEAHFQVAAEQFTILNGGVDDAVRQAYRRAVDLRSSMSRRDKELVEAYEPLFSRDPPDWPVTLAALRRLADAHPRDAEIRLRIGWLSLLRQDALATAREHVVAAAELDPDYADAWQARSYVEVQDGRFDEAITAADTCRRLAPNSVECDGAAVYAYAGVGRCEDAERASRGAVGTALEAVRVPILLGLDRPRDVVLAAMERSWKVVPEAQPVAEAASRSMLAFAEGDFVLARDHARRHIAAAPSAPTDPEGWIWGGLVSLATTAREMGELEREVGLLRDALRRRGDFEHDTPVFWNGEIALWDLLRRAGAASAADVAMARDHVRSRYAAVAASSPTLAWAAIEGVGVLGEEEARAALARKPAELQSGQFISYEGGRGVIGLVYFEAGLLDEAIPWLRAGARSCSGWLSPDTLILGRLALGDALVARGERDEGCKAYQWVIERWAAATPRSTSAELARKKAKAAGCPAPSAPKR